jgi:penicillin-binding protein 2
MLVFDQLKKNDPQLRAVTVVVLSGLALLLAGLWWVQVVSAGKYKESLQVQSFRTVRIPAVRGRIEDRNGNILAENRPTYNISLYLEELRKPFDAAYSKQLRAARAELAKRLEQDEARLGRTLSKPERRRYTLSAAERMAIRKQARYEVASNVVAQVSQRIQQPITLDRASFERHYEARLALPYPVLENLEPAKIARFAEQATSPLGVDLEIQSSRAYPFQTTAAHVLGSLRRDNSSMEGEESFFSYRLPDFRGVVGIEFGFDRQLRGLAGAKSVLVNNVGYRQTENVWTPAEPGSNVVLTLDLHIQQAAEKALQSANGPTTRGAVVVLDVHSGDILAMVSSPTFNPNAFVPRISREEYQRIADLHAEKNRATQENYMPGSIFKLVVGMAGLEAGWDPNALITVAENPRQPGKGYIMVGRRPIKDTAPPGKYDFEQALEVSCNAYFITCGLRIGPERILNLAQRLHLGEKAGLPTNQDVPGSIPTLKRLQSDWTDGNTANMSIGQDPIWVTPLQIAAMTAAIANHGKVLWPRLVDRIEPPDLAYDAHPQIFPSGQVRGELGLSARTFRVVHDAMLADTEDPAGTGRKAATPGIRICAKTGTAQVQDERNIKTGLTTWFASFAPYEQPRYAVVVMVENGVSGGVTCAPVAGKIYAAILERERMNSGKVEGVAKLN